MPGARAFPIPAVLLCLVLLAPIASHGAADIEWSFDGVERIVAISDVHGAHAELLRVLSATGLVDEDLRWSGGATYLVSVGDLVDRGEDSREVLDLLMRLEKEADAAGGRVLAVPGNHDVMNVTGDLRYVKPGEYAAFKADETAAGRDAAFKESGIADRAEFDARYPPGWFAHRAAFAPGGRYGRWIVSRPAFVRVNGTLFVHGGFSESVLDRDAEAVARSVSEEAVRYESCRDRLIAQGDLSPGDGVKAQLAAAVTIVEEAILDGGRTRRKKKKGRSSGATEAARCILELHLDGLSFTDDGPLWYRGLAYHDEASESDVLDAILEHLGGSRVVVGHTPTDSRRIESRLDGRVLLIDTGMLVSWYRGRPSALVIENGVTSAVYPDDGTREPPRTGSKGSAAVRDTSWRDLQVAERLAQGRITDVEILSNGVTGPRRVTLEDNAGTFRAVFKWFDTYRELPAQRNPLKRIAISDRYQYELAAYRLDRLLGLGLVPVTVSREVERQPGVLQAWIEDATDGDGIKEPGKEPPDREAYQRQMNTLGVFDALIHNEDRHTGNMLFTRDPWRIHLIDHTRAFRASRERPAKLRHRMLAPGDELRQRLLLLDRPVLQELLGDLLEQLQIDALLERRDALLRDARTARGVPAAEAVGP